MPDNLLEVEEAMPVYEELEGWGDISQVNSKEELPIALRKFLEFIEKETNFEVAYIGNGRGQEALIKMK